MSERLHLMLALVARYEAMDAIYAAERLCPLLDGQSPVVVPAAVARPVDGAAGVDEEVGEIQPSGNSGQLDAADGDETAVAVADLPAGREEASDDDPVYELSQEFRGIIAECGAGLRRFDAPKADALARNPKRVPVDDISLARDLKRTMAEALADCRKGDGQNDKESPQGGARPAGPAAGDPPTHGTAAGPGGPGVHCHGDAPEVTAGRVLEHPGRLSAAAHAHVLRSRDQDHATGAAIKCPKLTSVCGDNKA